ncbi:DNA-binding transcriptional LysR family regulator [Duganella sp. 1224]|uniref:LysR family transcriptional regulator n=1 Tax=Duganella sp. 1224 TaxID=2587052 RepID=UPI0015CEBED3|nr:LysR family transcriptional regulator [Duganella sp. 1224]NYE62930.1 DNA-binding transcriptional LysR family regulator [Duganella sp. 1224]
MQADLNDIVVFLRVAELGSFTQAAQALLLPKTTVSRKVRELEQRLGAQLLHRTTRRLSLTQAGKLYFEHCRQIPATLRDAESALREIQGQPAGSLRITCPYSVAISLLSPLLGEFHGLYPRIHVDLMLSHRVVDLISDKVDVALRLGNLPDSSMVARRLAVLPNRVYASDLYLEKFGEPTHPAQLRNHRALVTRVARSAAGYAWLMRNGETMESFEVTPIIEADDPEVLKAPLAAGAGLMMATDLIMHDEVKAGRVRPILSGWLGRCPPLHAVFPQGLVQPPALRAFIDFLVKKMADSSTVLREEAL